MHRAIGLLLAVSCTGGETRVPTIGETGAPTGPTASTGETGTPAPLVCDDPTTAVGAGSATLTVTEAATYCVLGVSDWEGLARKRRVSFVPGSYPWPGAAADGGAYRLPACIDDGVQVRGPDVGEVTWSPGDFSWITWEAELRQPVGDGTLVVRMEAGGDTPPDPALDGLSQRQTGDGSLAVGVQVCDADDLCDGLVPCVTAQQGDAFDLLTFARGELVLYLDVVSDGGIWIDPPRVLYRATGSIDGVTFEQRDHFALGFAYAAHGLERDVVVRFAEEVAGACGIVGNYGRKGEETLSLVDCAGTPLAELGPLE